MRQENLVAVVIPTHKLEMNHDEEISFLQCLKVLHKYPIFMVKPSRIDVSSLEAKYSGLQFESFEDEYFETVTAYNLLMLSQEFYQRFSKYKYILIYELDAFVFEDNLEYWCNLNYDYIGAPWPCDYPIQMPNISRIIDLARRINSFFGKEKLSVGNSGFCLRKTKSHLLALKIFSKQARSWNRWNINNDLFWASMRYFYPFFKVPDSRVAMQFSFEMEPEKFFELNGDRLPFGCHAWAKFSPSFWKTKFSNLEV
ncbi:DUF5672 family protein [Altericista sp. CCNU0014]|uniref:DUF5672 family protein n=1 Tax=Altericista sp. CCNU0014 TaxID=3082949 RepID=UPI00384C642B